MPLPSSGAISLSQVSVELGASATSIRSLNDTSTRNLFGVPSGTISMSQGYGKSNAFTFNATIAANTTNYNLKSAAIAAGWDQTTALNATITINSGVYVGSTSTGTFGFDTGASFPSGTILRLVNNGFIVGRGGNGGAGDSVGLSGGPALRAQAAILVTNNGTIGAGGGGGGGGYTRDQTGYGETVGGSGGGGGAGNIPGSGGAGASGSMANGNAGSSAGFASGGAGGVGVYFNTLGYGGNGGGLGQGGGAGAQGAGISGGSSNNAVSGNANITWNATGTRLGAIT